MQTERYIIRARIGRGIATFRFDSIDRATEAAEKLRSDGVEFTTNF